MRRRKSDRQPAVCIIRHAYYPDGHVRRDAEALAQAGYDAHVIALRRSGQPSRETLNGVTIHRLPVEHRRGTALRYVWEYLSFALLAMLKVGTLHRKARFHAVEVDNMPDILVFSALIPKLTGTPVILYIFDNMPELLTTIRKVSHRHPLVRLLALLERISTAFADQVIVTQEIARQLVIGRGVRSDKVHVVLNCPDEAILPVDATGFRAEDAGVFEIITHGAILERYGIQVVIDALPVIAATIPTVTLHVFGEGEHRPALEAQVARMALSDRVMFHGFAPFDDLLNHLRRADVGYVGMLCDVMLSNKLMEYTALNVPAVVARWPTYEHYFPDDAVAYFRPGDADDVARAVVAVHVDPDAAHRRARRAAALYQQYRWSVQRETYLGIYRGLPGRALRGGSQSTEYATESVEPVL